MIETLPMIKNQLVISIKNYVESMKNNIIAKCNIRLYQLAVPTTGDDVEAVHEKELQPINLKYLILRVCIVLAIV